MKLSRRIPVGVLVAFLLSSGLGLCNTDRRQWKLASGESFTAVLVTYDIDKDSAILRTEDGEEKTYSSEDFSPIDAAWLLEWAKVSAEMDEALRHVNGTFSHHQHRGEHTSDFYVYTPSDSKKPDNKAFPMLILFQPSGKGARYVKRMMPVAEELGIIVVCSDTFRNRLKGYLGLFKEILPTIEKTVPHDKNRLFLGGASGGAATAYDFSALVDRPWAGILAVAGWLGGKHKYDYPYPKGMRVAILNGDKDEPVNSWLESDVEALEAKGCLVNIFAYEGGHRIPSGKEHIEAMTWLLHGDVKTQEQQKKSE